MDTDAASRFIKQAISGVASKPNTATSVDVLPRSVPLPPKMTAKMIARAQYEHALEKERHEKDDDEDELQVYDEHGSDSSTDNVRDIYSTESISEDIPTSSTSLRRQHTPVDPVASMFLMLTLVLSADLGISFS